MMIGTCVGSDDVQLIPLLDRLHKKGYCDFVELYFKHNVTLEQCMLWQRAEVPVLYLQSEHDERAGIVEHYLEMTIFAADRFFNPMGVVYDAGYEGNASVDTALYEKLLPENMPYRTSFHDYGLMSTAEFAPQDGKFTLDVAHAWITANQTKQDPHKVIEDFLALKPWHFHITDIKDEQDHLMLGTGEMDFDYIFSVLPSNALISVETDNLIKERERAIETDLQFLKDRYENWRNNTSKK